MDAMGRLIELIDKAEYERMKYEMAQKFYPFGEYKRRSEFVADYLLANGVIVPPCEVGQTVYIIENGDMLDIEPSVCSVVEDETYEMCYGTTQSGELKWLYLVLETGNDFYDTDIGKTVFLTKEAAEEALKTKEAKEGADQCQN